MNERFAQLASKIQDTLKQAQSSLNEQQWYQELKAKWDELDPQSQTYLKYAGTATSVLFILFFAYSFVGAVYERKNELAQKMEILSLLQGANDEIQLLKRSTGASSPPATVKGDAKGDKEEAKVNWKGHFQSVASGSGISSLDVREGKKLKGTAVSKEDLYEISFAKVSIKQVIGFAFHLENGSQPVKIRKMHIDTKDDQGYLDASLTVSAFTIKAK